MAALQSRAVITPSATSASEDADEERRRELSPSPEVDLSSPELDDLDDDVPMPGTPIGSFSGRHTSVLVIAAQNHRAASPPLEKDEKEFTQTADGLQKRKLSGDLLNNKTQPAVEVTLDADEHIKDDGLFGGGVQNKAEAAATTSHVPSMAFLASPAMLPSVSFHPKKEASQDGWAKLESYGLDWDRSPETVELDELDLVLDNFYY